MNLTSGRVLVSASSLHIFTQCPRKFQFVNSNETFKDVRKEAKLICANLQVAERLTAIKNKRMLTSLEQQLKGNIKISASSLGQFKRCPKAFNYRITRTRQSDPFDITPYAFGTIVHSKLDDFYHGLQKEFGRLLDSPLKEKFIEFYNSDELQEFILNKLKSSNSWTESKQKVYTHFYESLKNDYLFIRSIIDKGCEPVFNFWPGTIRNPLEITAVNLPSLRFMGELDWFYENPRGNITIEDRKTSTSTFYLDYDQLYLYALMIEQHFINQGTPKKVDELNFCLVRSGKRFPIPFGSEQRDSLISNLSSLETCVELNTFPAVRSKGCERCPWRTLCSKQVGSKKEQADSALIDNLVENNNKR